MRGDAAVGWVPAKAGVEPGEVFMPGHAPAGDASFASFVAEHGPRLLRLAVFLAGSRADGEDLLQSALERTYRRWAHVQDGSSFARQCMARESARRHQRRRRWPQVSLDDGLLAAASAGPVAGPERDAVDRLSVVAALRTLPNRQRTVLVLRFLADMSEVDTAAVLGCSVGTVKSGASRGLAKLRAQAAAADQVELSKWAAQAPRRS